MKEKILNLRDEGKSYSEISKILDCSKSTVYYYCNRNSKNVIKNGINRRKMGIFIERNSKNINCIFCNILLKNKQKKFCSRGCQSNYFHNINYNKIIEGDKTIMKSNFRIDYFKKDILKEQDNKCDICKIEDNWNNKKLVFVLDHIDGDASNNKRDNLRCVCPNCDSQLDTYKSKNKNSARKDRYKK